MEIVRRKGPGGLETKIELDLDKFDDAIGLFAILTGNHHTANADQLARGQHIYAWLYQQVEILSSGTPYNPPPAPKKRT